MKPHLHLVAARGCQEEGCDHIDPGHRVFLYIRCQAGHCNEVSYEAGQMHIVGCVQCAQSLEIGLTRPADEGTTEDSFCSAILANPADKTHRFIFADWLEDHGRSAESIFVRADKVQADQIGPGVWSVVRRTEVGVGVDSWDVLSSALRLPRGQGIGFRFVRGERIVIQVKSATRCYVVLANGKRFARDTLGACAKLEKQRHAAASVITNG